MSLYSFTFEKPKFISVASLNFKLRKGTGSKASIVLFFQFGKGNRLRYSTGYKVQNAKNWNQAKQRIKNVVQEENRLAINSKLDEIRAFLNKTYISLLDEYGNDLRTDQLKESMDSFLGKERKNNDVGQRVKFLEFLPFFQWYLEHYKVNPLPTTKRPLGRGTIRTYKNAYNKLMRFNDNVYELNYNKITLDFYDDYMKYLQSQNLSANYIGTQIKILKTIMNLAYEKGFHENTDFMKRYFVKPVESVSNVYLTQNELLRLFNLDLINVKSERVGSVILTRDQLERARDLFLIGANTGLRISDFSKLSKDNIVGIKGRNYFNITSQKTGQKLTIPINPMVQEILNRRNGDLPEKIYEQHLNYAIKYLARLANIKTKESKSITKGGKTVIKTMEKWRLISSHTARRSFCTNAYKSGMPTIDIMAISGHKTERVFYNYIKVSPEERAQKISLHGFFNDSNLQIV